MRLSGLNIWGASRTRAFVFVCAATVASLLGMTSSAEEWSPPEDINLMSLEDLVHVEVTSINKRAERASEAAAAIFVITSEDIRRSGAKTIPEALRMAPGLIVAQVDSNSWAISARGFNGQFSDKLLVLMDGRTLYTPMFAGTYWDVQDYVMEDIDRIEVIRGPGATIWGANAVLGVISIITKTAGDTQGGEGVTLAGTERISQSVRYGGQAGENGHYRVYGKAFRQDALPQGEAGEEFDDNTQGSVGFRTDFTPSDKDTVTISGDVYAGETGSQGTSLIAPGTPDDYEYDEETMGANVIGRWDHRIDDRSSLGLQSYIDWAHRDTFNSKWDAFTFDLEFQHRISLIEHNELTWGLGYRRYNDDIEPSYETSFDPGDVGMNTFSGFVQDEHRWLDESLRLTVGTKLENNDFTGFEYQPTARLAYLFGKNTIWGAFSRTVQTRSRVDDLTYNIEPPPTVYGGDPDADAEVVQSWELGYRTEFLGKASLDLAGFYNDHQKQRDFMVYPPEAPGGPIIYRGGDDGEAQSWGVELAMNWVAFDWWTLGGTYTYLKIEKEVQEVDGALYIPGFTPMPGDPSAEEYNYPAHQIGLNSKMNLPYDLQFDTYAYYMDEVPEVMTDRRVRLDLRLGWTPTENFDVSLVGQNLLYDEEPEWGSQLTFASGRPGRSAYLKLTWGF